MAFWSGETISSEIPLHGIIKPFDPARVDCAAYTLRMGREYYVTPEFRDTKASDHTKKVLADLDDNGFGGSFQIPAGQFAFLLTEEFLSVPSGVIAFISLKTQQKWRGLINVSGFHVDPGFQGHLIYAVYNAGPRAIHLQRGQELFLIWFADLDKKDTEHYRKAKPVQTHISPMLVTDVGSPILSLQNLSDELTNTKQRIDNMTTYAAAAVVLATLIVNWTRLSEFITGLLKAGG